MANVALRTSLIWHDEVMSDVVSERPAAITIGPSSGSTFVTPEIGLPPEFPIVRPGNRGYLLALGQHMRGTICIAGTEHDVAEFVKAGDETGFRATAIGGNDWGVVELDDTGLYKLFFQFVPLDNDVPVITRPVLVAGLVGYLASIAILAIVFAAKGLGAGEALFRGLALASLALAAAGGVRWILKQDGESRASLAFSMLLHAVILFTTYQLYESSSEIPWPGSRHLTASYDPTRMPVLDEPVLVAIKTTPTVDKQIDKQVAKQVTKQADKPKEKQRPMIAARWHEPPLKDVATNADTNKQTDEGVLGAGMQSLLAGVKKSGEQAAKRFGNGTGVKGDGGGATKGPKGLTTKGGGNGKDPAGQYQKPEDVKVGPLRDSVCMGSCGGGTITELGPPSGPPTGPEGPTLTRKDVEDEMNRHRGLIRACYQKQVNLHADLAGSMSVHFEIGADGRVTKSKVSHASDGIGDVASCVASKILLFHFPAKGGANVNFPFVFTPTSN
jgi:hypothetical protein